jgi:hypothetical protein
MNRHQFSGIMASIPVLTFGFHGWKPSDSLVTKNGGSSSSSRLTIT